MAAVSAVLMLSLVAAAEAAPPRFWTKCETGSSAAQCRIPRGIAADPVSGHIYISDSANLRINEFTAWGAFVRAWGWGVATGTTAFQICTDATGCQAGLSGSGPGQFGGFGPQGIAMDDSGDVYVVDTSNHRVQKFDSDGNFLLMFGGGVNQGPNNPGNVCTAAHIAGGDTCGAGTVGSGNGQFGNLAIGSFVAIGPGGEVYVGDENRIQQFGANGTFVKSLPVPGEIVQSLAVDPNTGDLYAAFRQTATASKPDVLKLSPAGAPLGTLPVANPRAITTAVGSGNVYVVDGVKTTLGGELEIHLFTPGGTLIESFFDGLDASTGIVTNEACDVASLNLYVANSFFANSYVRAYGPIPDPEVCPPPLLPPTISDQYAVSVDAGSALVRAEINPHFWSGAVGTTTYYVQYGTAACVAGGWESSCVVERPAPPGAVLQSDAVDEDVTTAGVRLPGLEPATTYRYRFVAQGTGSGGQPVRGKGGTPGSDGADAAFTTFPLRSEPFTGCPNQAFRGGSSAQLPDCRAYEMVSPVDKNNGDIEVLGRLQLPAYATSLDQSSLDGDRVAYSSATAFADALSAPFTSHYIATRHAGEGWSTHAIAPPRESESISTFANTKLDTEFKGFTEDLCSAWLVHITDPPLAAGAVEGFLNVYRRQNCGPAADGYEPITTVEPGTESPTSYRPEVQGFSADGKHTLFVADDKLTENAASIAPKYQLYEHVAGEPGLRYVCVLPSGLPSGQPCSLGTPEAIGDSRENTVDRAVSDDGSRIFWSASENGPGPLYVRIDGAATIQLSAAPAQFWTAATDGSVAIFSTAGELFEFDVEQAGPTPVSIADGIVGVAGADEDASRIYFASTEVLGGDTVNSVGDEAQPGKPNFYLYERGIGQFTFIATLSGDDVGAQSPLAAISADPMRRASRVSPDGGHLAFTSNASLTEYENLDANSGEPDTEVYLYDEQSDRLACVSCNPSGARPSGRVFDNGIESIGVAAQLPAWENQLHAPRALSDDGSRIFFESFEALVVRDTNSKQDVYEWERGSEEACDELGAELFVEEAGGCLSLISSGESPSDSEFTDADPDGSDVFFKTASSLLPQDPGLIDLYDARVHGGLPIPAPPTPPCEGEACQSPPAPPDDPTPGTASTIGPGNQEKPPKGKKCGKGKHKVKQNGKTRCVKKQKHNSKGSRRGARGPAR